MMVLVSYDVHTTGLSGQRRLRHVAKACKDFGQRVQYSVFECNVDPAQWTVLKQRLIKAINIETDSLRFYFMGSNWKQHVEHIGAKAVPNLEEDTLIV
jgi:CRISPR-associated protein Cas2